MYNMWGESEVKDIEQGSPDQILDRNQLNKKYSKPLIAIDRDGVLIECNGNIKNTDQFVPIAGSIEAISVIRSKGYKLAIIFDQPGISKNELTIDQVEEMNAYMLNLFGEAGCPSIDGILYNASDSKDDPWSKPKPLMFYRLRDEFKVPIKGGYYVGDRLIDAKMADKAKLKPILVKTGKFSEDEKKFNSYSNRPLKKKTKIYNNLLDFAKALP
jgi:D-glycero-D-manno-heptose 1,7-bisphosphate phosphatase